MRAAILVLVPLAAWGASLKVTVFDPSGAVVVSATVRLAESTVATNAIGQAVFGGLPRGRVSLHVEAAGFAPKDQTVTLREGPNEISVRLRIAARQDEVSVSEDRREAQTDPRGPAMSTTLTPKEIDALPDDPEEMRQQLEAMGGPGAVIRVDGFRGGRLPHKSQIQSIRFKLTPYSAEEHDDGFNLVEITTKPGFGVWHGSLAYAYGGEVFNARNFFARSREPQQAQRVDLSATGPLVNNKSSLSLAYQRSGGYDSRATFGVLPEGPFATLVRLPSNDTNASARVQQKLPKAHLARFEYQYAGNGQSNLPATDLPDRLWTNALDQHVMRISDNGMIGAKLIHDLRFQIQWTNTGTASASAAPAVIVPGSFSQGGAGQNSQRRAREMDLTESVTWNRGRHNLRAGVEMDQASYRDHDLTNANGTFLFASLAAYAARTPLQYARRVGDVPVSYDQTHFAGFVQDDIRWRKNFSLSLGMRYETQTNLRDRTGFSPRIGFAWAPRGGKTTVRGGVGIYRQWFDATVYEQILRVDGSRQSDVIVTAPGYPDPFVGGAGAPTALPPSIYTRDPNAVMPWLVRASVGVQRALGSRFNLISDLRMQRGTHLLRARNLNAPIAGVGRPDPSEGNIMQVDSSANSSLVGWSVGIGPAPSSKGMGRVFWFVNYSLSRAINETDSPLSAPTNNADLRADRGPSSMDARHRFFAMVNAGVGRGFQVGTFFRASSALPYTITTGFDNNGDSVVNDRPPAVGRNSARGAGLVDVSVKLAWTRGYGKPRGEGGVPQQFRVMINGSGGGGVPDLPTRGAKPTLAQVQFYAQAYNALNHANLSNFVGVLTSPLFGQATSAAAGRRMELGVKVSF